MRFPSAAALATVLLVVSTAGAAAQTPPDGSLRVGVRAAPPFVIEDAAGVRSGIAIDLWRRVAEHLDAAYHVETRDVEGLLAGVEAGELDVAVAALTVTPEREARVDFCHPFYTAGLGIAVRAGDGSGWSAVLAALLSPGFAKAVGALALILLIAGALVWTFERRANDEQFGGAPHAGLGHSFWWAAVTMTTVGYGDKAPRTVGGRVVALVWMFASLVIVSGFTAAIASALTVGSLGGAIDHADDLERVRVGVLAGTTSQVWAEQRRLDFAAFDDVETALDALDDGSVRAVVHDVPLLRYEAGRMPGRPIEVLPGMIERQDYAWAVAAGSPLRESINRAMLDVLADPAWNRLVERYLSGD